MATIACAMRETPEAALPANHHNAYILAHAEFPGGFPVKEGKGRHSLS